MNIQNNKQLEFAGKLFFPQRCRFCNRVIKFCETMCKHCRETLNPIDGDICFLCGHKKCDCICKNHKSFYDAVVAPYYYNGAGGTAVRKMKFNKVPFIEESLINDMAACFNAHYKNYYFDFICYVPMTKRSQKRRGFNQSQILAEGLSRVTGIPLFDVLVKLHETETQHEIPGFLRSGNVRGVFDINETFSDKLTDARVLLIDDIKTTGSTLNECAVTLKINGASEVFCLTATITQKQEKPKLPDQSE